MLSSSPRKKTLHASEQDNEDVTEKILDYLVEIEGIEAQRLVYVDEAASDQAMEATHARAPKGERAYGRKPHNRGPRMSMLGALGLEGMLAGMMVEGYVDTQTFYLFVREFLLPQLKEGDVVIIDNYSAHKDLKIRDLLWEEGITLIFLPPYSPELSPIEHAWSKIKTYMKKAGARCKDSLFKAFSEAYQKVTASDAKGWFEFCGVCADLL